MSYEPPTVTELGSLRDLTLTSPTGSNKIGTSTDRFTAITQNVLVGSLTPAN